MHIHCYSPTSSILRDQVIQENASVCSGSRDGAINETAMTTISGHVANVIPHHTNSEVDLNDFEDFLLLDLPYVTFPLHSPTAEPIDASTYLVPAKEFIENVIPKNETVFGDIPSIGSNTFIISESLGSKSTAFGACGLLEDYVFAFRGKNLETDKTTLCLFWYDSTSLGDVLTTINDLQDKMVNETGCDKNTIEVFIVGGKDNGDTDLIQELANNPENKIKCLLNPKPNEIEEEVEEDEQYLDVVLTEDKLYFAFTSKYKGGEHLLSPSDINFEYGKHYNYKHDPETKKKLAELETNIKLAASTAPVAHGTRSKRKNEEVDNLMTERLRPSRKRDFSHLFPWEN